MKQKQLFILLALAALVFFLWKFLKGAASQAAANAQDKQAQSNLAALIASNPNTQAQDSAYADYLASYGY